MAISMICDICGKPIDPKENFKDIKRLSGTNNIRLTISNVDIMSNKAPPRHKQAVCKTCIINCLNNSYIV